MIKSPKGFQVPAAGEKLQFAVPQLRHREGRGGNA
jgi:hypothetical protein